MFQVSFYKQSHLHVHFEAEAFSVSRWFSVLGEMGLPRTRNVDGKVGEKRTKKRFTRFSVKEVELAKEWFKNDVGGVSHLFFRQGFTKKFAPGCAALEDFAVVEAKLFAN